MKSASPKDPRSVRGAGPAGFAGGLIALLASLLLLAGCEFAAPPEAREGVVDLSSRALHNGPAVRLAGQWRSAPNALIDADASDGAFPQFSQLPDTWEHSVHGPALPSGHGYATYRVRVRLPAGARDLALRITTVGTAYRLYVDGLLLAQAGLVSTRREGAEAAYLPLIVPLPPQTDDEFVLQLQASNFHYANGGLWEPLWIGDQHALQAERELRVGLAAYLAGTFFIIGLYHLVLWLIRRDDFSALAFALLSAAVGVRGLATDETYLVELIPGIRWETVVRVEFLSMLLMLGSAWAFVRGLFPDAVPKALANGLGACSFVFATLVIFLDVDGFSRLLPGMQAILVASAILGPALVLRAAVRGHEGAGLFLVGILAIALAGLHDMLITTHRSLATAGIFGGHHHLQPFGLLGFVLCQTALMALRSGRAFTDLERATADLQDTRDAIERYAHELEARVAERTTELADLAQELERQSRVDGLTGIGNRRCFDEQLEATWSDHLRRDSQFALVLADVDHFKGFNDTQGHVEGDRALRAICQVLEGTANRPRDLVARYGGEEIVAILPDTQACGAQQLAERMRMAVADLALPHPESEHGIITISAGVAAMRPTAEQVRETLIQRADAALYRAKREDRNRIAVDRHVETHANAHADVPLTTH